MLAAIAPFVSTTFPESKTSQDTFMSACVDKTRILYFPFITPDRIHNATALFLIFINQLGSPLPCTQTNNNFGPDSATRSSIKSLIPSS